MFTSTKFNRFIFLFLYVPILMMGPLIYPGTTGKIAGKILDKNTGESLLGANIIVMGTTLGASADVDGNYYIINIPPGEHEV